MTEIVAGLCSVTFRALDADQIVAIATRNELRAIEWGADVHAPPGDLVEATRIREQCAANDLACPSYGSYWFAGQSSDEELPAVLASARALGATTVRVWAPGDPRPERWADATPVVEALRNACDRAEELTIAVEFHPGTLTETARSTRELLASIDRANMRTYWQPHPGADHPHALTEIDPVVLQLAHLHVFSWDVDSNRLPLDAHAQLWRKAFEKVANTSPQPRMCAYLEFVAHDDPRSLDRDAATLRGWLREAARR
jgi:sugar phosphate isomerase/epimerase